MIQSLIDMCVLCLIEEVKSFKHLLSRYLHENDAEAIFGQVVKIFHEEISDAYSGLTTPQAKSRSSRDIEHILEGIQILQTDNTFNKDGVQNLRTIDELLQKLRAESKPCLFPNFSVPF